MPVYFHTEAISYSIKNPVRIKSWIKQVIKSENKKTGNINFILCSDEFLLGLNQQFLKHDYYTDVISFDQSNDKQTISGDIYISIDRVKENAINTKQQKTNTRKVVEKELHRVMIHGILHLLGYDDKTIPKKKHMRAKEDNCLKMMKTIK